MASENLTSAEQIALLQTEAENLPPDLDPGERWRLIQNLMTIGAQLTGRNTPAACLANQRRILEAMAKLASRQRS